MEFRLLGPVELRSSGRAVRLGGARQRSVLAALAVDAGGSVSAETLIDRVWGQAPPARARHALHVYIARLRGLLDQEAGAASPARVVRHAGGYLLDVGSDCVDAHRFQRLVGQARGGGCQDQQQVALLRQALDLWRGPPLAVLPGEWAARVRHGWQQQYLDAVIRWAHAWLRLGDPGAVLARLTELTGEHPMLEPLAAAYLRALCAAGRPSDALTHYLTVRRLLAEELGTDPGPELQRLHRQILTCDPALALAFPAPSLPPPAGPPIPRQLPAPPQGFIGRTAELAQLDRVLDAAMVAITAIDGMAGVGKTALAVRWAHRVADRFPDGQLYANLRGFDPGGTPMAPVEAIRGLLAAFPVPPRRIPAELPEQTALYRSVLAGKRVLVVLDNARDAEQVRPLLPSTPGCAAVVTSRSQLTGLIAGEGAHCLTLGVLPAGQARELLARRIGAARVAAEPGPVGEIVLRCAGLPLALAVISAHAATRPDFPLAAVARALRETHGGLDAFQHGDPVTDLRGVFSWSYRRISRPAARLFRLLALHPGPDAADAAAASLAGLPLASARRLLAELARASLIVEHYPGRYTFHDLLRAYATEQSHLADGDGGRPEALGRLLDHYLHNAHASARLLHPHRISLSPAPARPGVTLARVDDHRQAMAWFTAEHAVLLAVVQLGASHRLDPHVWQLAWCLVDFLDRRGHWPEWELTQRTALSAAKRLGDREGLAHSHRGLGRAAARTNHITEARTHLLRALRLFHEIDHWAGAARTHLDLSSVLGQSGRDRAALGHARAALKLYLGRGDLAGQARALNAVGWDHAQLGHYDRAIVYCERALALYRNLNDRAGAAATWDSLGYVRLQLGRCRPAIRCYLRACGLYRELGDRYNEAGALTCLGTAFQTAGRHAAARDTWRRALDVFEELGHPDADRVRAQLARLTGR